MLINAFPQGQKDKPIVTEEITSSKTWTVPEGVNEVEVMVFGGGGAGYYHVSNTNYYGGGGGSGYMNRGKFSVSPGQQIAVTIGAGASTYSGDGGTTSFGDMLSARGGQGGGTKKGGDGFAGGGGYDYSTSTTTLPNGGRGVGGGDGGQSNTLASDYDKILKGADTATALGGSGYKSSYSSSYDNYKVGGGGGGMNGGNGGQGGSNGGGGGGGYGTTKLTGDAYGGTGYGAGGGGTSMSGAPGICVITYPAPPSMTVYSPALNPASFNVSGSGTYTIAITGISPTAVITRGSDTYSAFTLGGAAAGGTVNVVNGTFDVATSSPSGGVKTFTLTITDTDTSAYYITKTLTMVATVV